MLEIKFIRGNPGLVQRATESKGIEVDIFYILKLDDERRRLSTEVQLLRAERNKAAGKKDIEKGKKIKEKLEKEEYELRSLEERLNELLLKIPNLPLKHVPIGDESKNEVIKKVGSPKKFDFAPRDHLEIGENLDLIDVKRAAKVSGTRFGYLKNEAVLLEFALVQFVLEKLTKLDFIPVVPPALIKKEITDKLGYWHGEKNGVTNNEEYYWLKDPSDKQELYLIGTAEHSVVSMHKDEVFKEADLPKRYIAFSPAFRREAGSYGKDTRGIFRVHEFDKLEMISYVRPEDDGKERKKLLQIAEDLIKELGLSYQLVRLASQDMSFPAAETIDIETWIPSQKKYRETHSISTTTDFQARRLNIRYEEILGTTKNVNPNGQVFETPMPPIRKYVHILNGTAFAIGRTIIAILENYQQKDGSVVVPSVLRKYMHNIEKISPKNK